MSRPSAVRTAREYECQFCGTKFHPLYGSMRMYCSVQCSGKSNSRWHQRMREVKEAMKAGPMTPDELAEFIAEWAGDDEDADS